jgi:hypothetical protein
MTRFGKYLPAAFVSLTFALAYLYFFMTGVPLLADADVPWHIAAGHLIRAFGGLPAHDPWSYTAGEQPWYIISWLWDVLLSFVDQIGPQAVYIFAVSVAALAVASLAWHLLNRENIGGDAIIFTLFMATLALIDFAVARPHLIGLLFIPWVHLLLHRSRTDLRLLPLLWLPGMMVLWVNMHASFIAGFTLIGAYGLEALITRRWQWFKQLLLVGILCLVALLINPYGLGMIAAVMRTLDSVTTKYIAEWLPFVFGNFLGVSLWFMMFVLAGSLREPTVPLADKIISVAWLIIMLFSVRNAAIFVLVSAPYMAINLQRFLERLDAIRTRRADIVVSLSRPGMRAKMALVAAVLVIGSAALFDTLRGQGALIDSRTDPGPAIAYVAKHYPGKRILNDYNFGGRIIHDTHGTLPLFADGRAGTAYPESVLTEYLAFMKQEEGWQSITSAYKISVILVAARHPFAAAYDRGQHQKQWKRMYRDEVASVFVRR